MITLETPRLILRRLKASDAPFMLQLLNDPAFIQHIGDRLVRTEPEAKTYIESRVLTSYEKYGHSTDLVIDRSSGESLGICGLIKRETLPEVDLGFAFLPQHLRKGFAFESSHAVLLDARSSGKFKKVLAITSMTNMASIGLLEKLGFHYQGPHHNQDATIGRLFELELKEMK